MRRRSSAHVLDEGPFDELEEPGKLERQRCELRRTPTGEGSGEDGARTEVMMDDLPTPSSSRVLMSCAHPVEGGEDGPSPTSRTRTSLLILPSCGLEACSAFGGEVAEVPGAPEPDLGVSREIQVWSGSCRREGRSQRKEEELAEAVAESRQLLLAPDTHAGALPSVPTSSRSIQVGELACERTPGAWRGGTLMRNQVEGLLRAPSGAAGAAAHPLLVRWMAEAVM